VRTGNTVGTRSSALKSTDSMLCSDFQYGKFTSPSGRCIAVLSAVRKILGDCVPSLSAPAPLRSISVKIPFSCGNHNG